MDYIAPGVQQKGPEIIMNLTDLDAGGCLALLRGADSKSLSDAAAASESELV